jgi:hypothetical protein
MAQLLLYREIVSMRGAREHARAYIGKSCAACAAVPRSDGPDTTPLQNFQSHLTYSSHATGPSAYRETHTNLHHTSRPLGIIEAWDGRALRTRSKMRHIPRVVRTVGLSLLALVAVSVTGCLSDPDTEPGPVAPMASSAQPAGAGPYCTRDAQCEVGYECTGGECLDATGRSQALDHPCDDLTDPDHDLYHCGGCYQRCLWRETGVIQCVDGVCLTSPGTPND